MYIFSEPKSNLLYSKNWFKLSDEFISKDLNETGILLPLSFYLLIISVEFFVTSWTACKFCQELFLYTEKKL